MLKRRHLHETPPNQFLLKLQLVENAIERFANANKSENNPPKTARRGRWNLSVSIPANG